MDSHTRFRLPKLTMDYIISRLWISQLTFVSLWQAFIKESERLGRGRVLVQLAFW